MTLGTVQMAVGDLGKIWGSLAGPCDGRSSGLKHRFCLRQMSQWYGCFRVELPNLGQRSFHFPGNSLDVRPEALYRVTAVWKTSLAVRG